MKALVYHGPMDVRVDDTPKPQVKDQEDIILKITNTTICGSDLHLYHGTTKGMEPGQTLGHEFAGVVDAAGDRVGEVKVGDRWWSRSTSAGQVLVLPSRNVVAVRPFKPKWRIRSDVWLWADDGRL